MTTMLKKNFDTPDNIMQPAEKIKVDIVQLGNWPVMRVTASPGWKWSIDLKPVQKTESCQTDHLLYMISGNMTVRMDDGQEFEYGPGDLASIPPGHDGWDSSDKPTVWIEIPH
jgi:mannose-6-phosphate isomerase-like protein (cupin superfamily)